MGAERESVTMEKNTQQPVAWLEHGKGGEVIGVSLERSDWTDPEPLFATPPMPRDVLVKALDDMMYHCACQWSNSDPDKMVELCRDDIERIADCYASKVQPEPVCQTCGGARVIGDYLTLVHDCPDCARCDSDPELVSYAPDMATCTLRIGDEQYLFDRHVGQPEPVNQPLQDVAQRLRNAGATLPAPAAGGTIESAMNHGLCIALALVEEAIAAAEAAQPVGPRECGCGWRGESADCVWCGNVGPLCPKCHETTEEAQQPASAQQVIVPDENDPAVAVIAFVLNLERTGHSGEGIDFLRLWNEGEFEVCRREWPDAPPECYIGADPMLSAAQKPEGAK